MFVAPDQGVDAAKFHTEEIRRAAQRDERAPRTKMLTRVRLILRRVLGRQNPPASPDRDSNVRPTAWKAAPTTEPVQVISRSARMRRDPRCE